VNQCWTKVPIYIRTEDVADQHAKAWIPWPLNEITFSRRPCPYFHIPDRTFFKHVSPIITSCIPRLGVGEYVFCQFAGHKNCCTICPFKHHQTQPTKWQKYIQRKKSCTFEASSLWVDMRLSNKGSVDLHISTLWVDWLLKYVKDKLPNAHVENNKYRMALMAHSSPTIRDHKHSESSRRSIPTAVLWAKTTQSRHTHFASPWIFRYMIASTMSK
jgi:hypothetical protein